jgi:hypothetical protein
LGYAEYGPHGGRLAGPVGSEEAEHLPGRHGECQAVEGDNIAVAAIKVVEIKHRRSLPMAAERGLKNEARGDVHGSFASHGQSAVMSPFLPNDGAFAIVYVCSSGSPPPLRAEPPPQADAAGSFRRSASFERSASFRRSASIGRVSLD